MNSLLSAAMSAVAASVAFAPWIASGAEVIGSKQSWRYFKGTQEPSSPDNTTWRTSTFDDSTWAVGVTPFYYGEPYVGTELTDMRGKYTTVYVRTHFAVDNPGILGSVTLNVLADDGFVAWLNGQEIGRFNVAEGPLAVGAVSLPALEEPLPYQQITINEPWKYLVAGDNVLAIQALNASLGESTDFVLNANASVVEDTVPPVLGEVYPPPSATVDGLVQVEVNFSEPVQGVDAGDLLINGNPAGAVQARSGSQYVFGFVQPANGTVEFRWKDGHGITDILGSPHPFAGGSWTLTLDPTVAHGKVYISEFMADNDKSAYDEDCDPSDWIEIYNSGTTAVNLGGWALTDDATDKRKWRFPSYQLEPDTYMMVFASQKDKTVISTVTAAACRTRSNAFRGFHTNFKLSNDGEYLALVDPNGDVISEFTPKYPKQQRDVSYGRVPGAGDKVGFFVTPTPRAANSASGDGFSSAVNFSKPSGMVSGPFALTLDTTDAGSVIKYTIDGTLPAETNKNLLTYTAAIQITNTMMVRARAYTPGLLPGPPSTAGYVFLTNSSTHLASFTSSLPIIVMTTLKSASVSATRNTLVHFSLFEPKNGLASLRRPPDLVTRAGIKTRGSSTGSQPQSNFALDLWDEFDQDQDHELLGMPADSEWVLYAPSGFDPMLIHNAFTMELSTQMGFSAPRTRFVEVYLNKGGVLASNQWFGLYVLMEKPGLSKGRVNAPKARPEDVDFPEVTGSYLFKTDRLDDGDTGFSAGGALNAYVEPKEREMKSPQRAAQVAYLSKFWRDLDASMRVANPKLRDPVLGYRGYIEVTNWMDFHLLETLSGQVDAIRLSTYFYKRREGKLEYGPRWDYDRAWESKDDGRDDNPKIWDTGGGLWGPPWWGVVLKDTDAWQVWADRWAFHRAGPLSLSNMYSVIDRMTNQLRWVQPREALRWAETRPRLSYSNETRIMKSWISNRVTWLDSQFAAAPRLTSTGAVVTPGFKLSINLPPGLQNPATATIYYTLDGTDPRPPGGTGLITGFEYKGTLTIETNTRVMARLRDSAKFQRGPPSSTPWSAPVVATFIVTPPPLVVTELMFHPEKPAGSATVDSDYEYIELKNVSDRTLDLKGYHFTAGVDFAFTANSAVTSLAPGERVLVVKNRTAFLERYPGITAIAGEFAGTLDDAGERLALAGPVEEPIFDFSYSDDWYKLADGPGFSLVLVNEAIAPDQLGRSGSWRLSALPGGSPGAVDGAPVIPPRVVVNEVLPRSAAAGGESQVELANLEDTAVDISGWWISDSFSEPRKVRLPSGTRIARRGFAVIRQAVFNPDNGSGFSLNPKGDDFWIFSADREGALTGYFHGFSFGSTDPGQSIGRQISSAGAEEFVLQKAPSMGVVNVGPSVGPVIFSEIFFQPPASGVADNTLDEFVELWNISNLAVGLFDPSHVTNTWRVQGGIDFEFPRAFSLQPGGRVILVGFDPFLEPAVLESLQRRVGLDPSTPVLGPWLGKLSNGSESLRLERPGTPIVDPDTGLGSAPYIVVEEVPYSDHFPWPGNTSSTGWSLVRTDSTLFGSEPAAWASAPRTAPGTDSDGDGLPDAWETQYGLSPASAEGDQGASGDPDGDGFNNRHELLNGTDPKNPASALRLGVATGGTSSVNLLLAAAPGRKFRVESHSGVAGTEWQGVREVVVPASGLVIVDTEPVAGEVRFFRLSVVP